MMGDFNANISESALTSLCNLFKFTNRDKKPTCYKNPNNPSYIDIILTNCVRSFHITYVFETGLSDSHKVVVTPLRLIFESLSPKVIKYITKKNLTRKNLKIFSKAI